MGNQTALIFGAVGYPDWSFLAPLHAAAAVFCADGGVNHVQAAGFSPDYYIGDGDSGGVPPAGNPAVQLPVHKDLTDLQAAWEQAYALGCRRIVLTGCTGGRQDHHVAALHETARAAARWSRKRFVRDVAIRYPQRIFGRLAIGRRKPGEKDPPLCALRKTPAKIFYVFIFNLYIKHKLAACSICKRYYFRERYPRRI